MRQRRPLLALLAVAAVAAVSLGGAIVTAPAQAATSTLISKGKPASASSIEGAGFEAAKAFDGNATSRWASVEGHDPEWIQVDLGTGATVNRVVLKWEAAYAKAYRIEMSNDGTSWAPLKTVTAGDGGTDEHTSLNGTGRYLRVTGTARGTAWGYSLFELEAYGTAGEPGTNPGTGTPIQKAGALKVCGLQLCSQDGVPVQLRGMSTHGTQWYAQCLPTAALDSLATDWKADLLRVSTYVEREDSGWESNPAHFTKLAGDLIQKAYDRGMYAIADWHQLRDGDPNANLENAKRFFTDIATRHGSKGTVLYEIANEPSYVPWSTIKSYAEKIIPVIRAIDPDAVILVGTPDWSSFGVSGDDGPAPILASPVNATNIMYVFHFYAASHDDLYLRTLDEVSGKLPVFVTEWGAEEASGDGALDFAMAERYLELMDRKKISWAKWNFSDDHRTGAAFKVGTCANGGPWTGSSLKPTGAWVIEHIRAGAL